MKPRMMWFKKTGRILAKAKTDFLAVFKPSDRRSAFSLGFLLVKEKAEAKGSENGF